MKFIDFVARNFSKIFDRFKSVLVEFHFFYFGCIFVQPFCSKKYANNVLGGM